MGKKFISVLLAAILLLLCCGCKKNAHARPPAENPETEASAGKQRNITLLYCQSDTVNPYTCATKYNQDLCDLLYDPLIKLDETYTVQNCLAAALDITSVAVQVQLKSVKFTNGAALSANDVQYSFELAKNLAQYKNAFAAVKCTVIDNRTLRFQLNKPDIDFVHFLDFPIIQAKSDTIKNSDHILQPPVGCGRYVYVYDQAVLTANTEYHGGKVNIQTVRLLDTPDRTAAGHHLEVGAVDYYYSDLADGVIPKLNGVSRIAVLNKLVYIGMNQTDPLLKNPQIRRTLSAALNRTALINTAFHSNAVLAQSPFHPFWKAADGYKYIEEKENIDVVVANLKEIGYNTKDTEGYFVNAAGKRLSFSMLCTSSDTMRMAAAEQMKSQFKKIGIDLQITVLTFAEFTARLADGRFQLFLSEVGIAQNMDISAFAIPGGAAAYGVVEETPSAENGSSAVTSSDVQSGTASVDPGHTETTAKKLSQAIAEYKNQQASIFDVVTVFNAAMPVVPICFKCGISVCASDFATAPYATSSDVFYNIENATFK